MITLTNYVAVEDGWEEHWEIKTDLEPNAKILRIVEMLDDGLITLGQAWRMIVDEVHISFGRDAAIKLLGDNPHM